MGGIGRFWRVGAAVILVCIVFAVPVQALTTAALLDTVQVGAFRFFWWEANPANGLIRDRSTGTSPCSIASLGFGLSAICIGIDHGWITKAEGRTRVLAAFQTLWTKPQGTATSGTIGYKGFFYHFINMNTGLRAGTSELSSIDTALLLAGVIDAKQYFSGNDPGDVQVRALADSITYRVDWEFMRDNQNALRMGWKPESGFSGYGLWIGYNEAMIMNLLALGSPTHPVPATVWSSWLSGYQWRTNYGYTYFEFPPLFGHQYSHCWIDFRYWADAAIRFVRGAPFNDTAMSYFENSRRATLAARQYCMANPGHFTGYGPNLWGLTACDGPTGYKARGAPPGMNDDGTIAPTAAAGSIAFAPEVVIPALHNMFDTYGAQLWSLYGFRDAFNLTQNWWDLDYIGIDEGPIIIMIENYRTGSVWRRFMQNPGILAGMTRAGFTRDVLGTGEEAPVESRPLALLPSAPNPFRSETVISYRLAESGPVWLGVFDAVGRPVRTLVDGVQPSGAHAVRLPADGLASGVYFYRLVAGGQREEGRCLLVR